MHSSGSIFSLLGQGCEVGGFLIFLSWVHNKHVNFFFKEGGEGFQLSILVFAFFVGVLLCLLLLKVMYSFKAFTKERLKNTKTC
jgi:hypothetical protein